MRSLVIACGRDRRWHDKHGAGERVWILVHCKHSKPVCLLRICQNVRHVMYSVSSALRTVRWVPVSRRMPPGPSHHSSSTPFDFASGPSTATTVSASAAPATASPQGRHRRLGYELAPAQAALRLAGKKKKRAVGPAFLATAWLTMGRPKGNLAGRSWKTTWQTDSNATLWRHATMEFWG